MAVPHVVALRSASAAIARSGVAPASREGSARRWRPVRLRSPRAPRPPRARFLWAAARAACRLDARRRASRRCRRRARTLPAIESSPVIATSCGSGVFVIAEYSARKIARPAEGPSMLPPPTTLMCRSNPAGSMPASARSTLVALKTESFAIEPAVSLKRTVPLPGCERGNATASISMMLPD